MDNRRQQVGKATYDLDKLKNFIDEGKFTITRTCRKEFTRLGYSDIAVLEIIKRLTKNEIFKTMPAEKMPQLMQDVYKTVEKEDRLYIKMQENSTGNGCVIIQFKME